MATLEQLMEALKDPNRKDALAAKAAMQGPPPDISMADLPNVPGMQSPGPQMQAPPAAGIAGIGQAAPAGAPAGTPEENKSKWVEFIDRLLDPQGAALPMLTAGAHLLQPRTGGQTQAGAIGQAMMQFAGTSAQQRTQQKAMEMEQKKLDAQIGLTEAQTTGTLRVVESADVDDEFTRARTELARIQASKGSEGDRQKSAQEVILQTVAQALHNTYPEKYRSFDEALVAAWQFDQTKGESPRDKAIISLMENLPFMPRNQIAPTLGIIKEALDEVKQPAPGATAERESTEEGQLAALRAAAPPIDSVTDAQWLAFEGYLAAQKQRAELIYGKDVVAQKILEAKKRFMTGKIER